MIDKEILDKTYKELLEEKIINRCYIHINHKEKKQQPPLGKVTVV